MCGIEDLARDYADKHGVSIATAKEIVKNVAEVMCDEVINKGGFSIIGKFSITRVKRKARNGINPVTKETVTIPESYSIKAKAGSVLKSQLNS